MTRCSARGNLRAGRPRAQAPGRGCRRHRDVGLALERPASREHLVEDDAQRPDVRSRIGTVAADLLRRHVQRCAERRTGAREIGGGPPSFARPKSRIFTRPSLAIIRLAGLMSRCTIPDSWARASALRDRSRCRALRRRPAWPALQVRSQRLAVIVGHREKQLTCRSRRFRGWCRCSDDRAPRRPALRDGTARPRPGPS